MPTIAEAQAQVKSAKQELEEAQTEAQQREADIKLSRAETQQRLAEKTRIGGFKSQLEIERQFGVGTAGRRIRTQRLTARKEFGVSRLQLEKEQEELDVFKQEIGQRELEIGTVEQEISRVQAQQQRARQLQIAKEVFLDIRSGAELSGIPKEIQEQARREIAPIKKGREVRALFAGIEQLKGGLLPGEKISSIDLKKGFVTIESSLQSLPKEQMSILAPVKLDGVTEPSLTPLPEKGFLERVGVPKVVRQTLGVTPFEGRLAEISTGTQLQSALFLSFAGVKAPVGKLKIPIRGVKEPSFVEIQQPLVISGKPTTLSTFRITREITPPTLVPSKTEGLLGGRIQPQKLEVTTTPFGVVDKLPVFTLTTKGGRVGQLDVITGTSRPIGVESLGQVSPRQQLLFQRFAEDVAGGRPVSLRNVPRVLRRDSEFSLGELQSFKLGRVDIGEQPTQFDLFPVRQVGRRRTRFETLAQFPKIKETDQFQVFKGAIFFKEVTKPFARAAGKTPKLKGLVIRRKEPIVIGEETGVESLRFGGGKRTSLEKTFAKQFQQQELKLLPKPPPPSRRPKVTLKTQRPSRVGGISSLLPRVSIGVSARTDIITGDFARGFDAGFRQIAPPTAAQREREGLTIQLPRTLVRETLITRQITRQEPISMFRLEQRQLPKQLGIEAVQFRELTIQRGRIVQREKQAQKLRQRLQETLGLGRPPRPPKARPISSFRFPRPTPTPKPTPLFDLPKKIPKEKKKKKLKGRIPRPPIRPSLTGIITGGLGLPKSVIIKGVDIGIPIKQLRGLEL